MNRAPEVSAPFNVRATPRGVGQGQFSSDNDDRVATVENGVNLPLVLRLFLEFNDRGRGGVAEGDTPEGFEFVDIWGPFAVPMTDGRAELDRVDFVPAAGLVTGVVDPGAGDDEEVAGVEFAAEGRIFVRGAGAVVGTDSSA